MLARFRKLDWRTCGRRLCAGVTLLAYLAAAIGFPLPATAAPAAAPTHGCGQRVCCCGSAEQCQSSGCGCSRVAAPPRQEEVPGCCSKPSKKPASTSSVSVREAPPKTPSKSKDQPVRWVVGVSALKCGGGATHWIGAQAALPPAAPIDWQPSWPYCHSIPTAHQYPFVIVEDPSDPPPRLAAI